MLSAMLVIFAILLGADIMIKKRVEEELNPGEERELPGGKIVIRGDGVGCLDICKKEELYQEIGHDSGERRGGEQPLRQVGEGEGSRLYWA